jgi:hypothetical protein
MASPQGRDWSTRWALLSLAALVLPLALLPLTAAAQVRAGTNRPGVTQAQASGAVDVRPRAKPSWNPHVRCRATVTTLRKVLGDKQNTLGGATYRGGAFRPGTPDRRDFTPPCKRRGVPTFVQLNRVKVGNCTKINEDGDWTCNLTDPTMPRRRTVQMSQIHVETDQKFRTRSGWSRPVGGTLIDVQGFVFWDPGHTTESWHHFSGWEIHSLTAWRHSPKR